LTKVTAGEEEGEEEEKKKREANEAKKTKAIR
jgi:hypothetical protein